MLVCPLCFEQRSGQASLSKPEHPAEVGSGRMMPSSGCLREAAGTLLGGGSVCDLSQGSKTGLAMAPKCWSSRRVCVLQTSSEKRREQS